jgi:hypothetical protein
MSLLKTCWIKSLPQKRGVLQGIGRYLQLLPVQTLSKYRTVVVLERYTQIPVYRSRLLRE